MFSQARAFLPLAGEWSGPLAGTFEDHTKIVLVLLKGQAVSRVQGFF